MLRTGLLILSGNAAASLLLLARNLIVARLIPLADYGVAATFAVAMAVVEMMSALGLQQQIVQAKEGDDPRFQAALQGFQMLRGVILGAILFGLAGPMAAFLGIPGAAWAYQVLALVPVLNAAQHFDIHRLNRQMRFAPLILTGAVPALASLVAIWPLAAWTKDWQVMLWAILIQATLGALTSHLVAERPWRLVFDRRIMAASFRFGWPLLTNGVLLFLVFQGDKLIVGRALGMETLAIFAMGMTLTLTPTLVLSKSAMNLFLPRLSAIARGTAPGEAQFQKLSVILIETYLWVSTIFMLGTAVAGPFLIGLVLGGKYAALQPILIWLAVMQGIRLLKGGPSILALARGYTGNALVANLGRALLLPVAWYMLARGGDLVLLIAVGILGEGIGILVAYALVRRRVQVSFRPLALPILMTAIGSASTLVYAQVVASPTAGWAERTVVLACMVGAVVGLIVVSPEARRYLRDRIFSRRRD